MKHGVGIRGVVAAALAQYEARRGELVAAGLSRDAADARIVEEAQARGGVLRDGETINLSAWCDPGMSRAAVEALALATLRESAAADEAARSIVEAATGGWVATRAGDVQVHVPEPPSPLPAMTPQPEAVRVPPIGVPEALRAWAAGNGVRPEKAFGPRATEASVAEAESVLGAPLPAEYRRFLLEVGPPRGAVRGVELLALGAAADQYRAMLHLAAGGGLGPIRARGPVRAVYMSERWWPATRVHGASEHHCIDLDPPAGGAREQVILVCARHDERRVVAPSFVAFVGMLLDGALADE